MGSTKEKMKFLQSKKGVIENLAPIVISLVALGITLVVAFLIMGNVASNSSVAANTNATAAINTVQNSAATIPGWLPIIVITIVGALLIALVSMFRGRK